VSEACLPAALRVHSFLSDRYWDGSRLVGPDMGIRFNYRVGRFVKSALSFVPWRDHLFYMQAQAYWCLANRRLHEATGDPAFAEIADAGARRILREQRSDGGWDYPNPEWSGRTATTEGTWAAVSLVEAFRQTGEPEFLDGAVAWLHFLDREIGFQRVLGGEAVNYFAGRAGAVVPNCSTLVLHFLGELGSIHAVDPGRGAPIVTFLTAAQAPSGELPYAVSTPLKEARLTHFQCVQYNAFQCLDLMRYYHLTGDPEVLGIIQGVLRFLEGGIADGGHALYQCGGGRRRVVYHSAALAAAFAGAKGMGEGRYDDLTKRATAALLRDQRPAGSFPHSFGDYGALRDRRAYPRAHAMILSHLLVIAGIELFGHPSAQSARDLVHVVGEEEA
jgi:hypothetical protein